MFEDQKVAEAFSFAVIAHGDQKYGNMPYFTHFLQVANNIPYGTQTEKIAALLHDVVEDTSITLPEIEQLFGPEVSSIVDLVTKTGELTHAEEIDRIIESGNTSAIKVKMSDTAVNLSGDKSHMSVSRRDRLMAKYTSAYNKLYDNLYYKGTTA